METSIKLTHWKDIAELTGIAAIVGSLIFVGLQMQQAHEIAMNELSFVTAERYIETRSSINEHADIWARGNEGESLDRADTVIYENLVRNMNTHAFWTSNAQRRLGGTGEVPIHDFAAFLYQYPAALKVWESQQTELRKYREPLMTDEPEPNYPVGVTYGDWVRADLERLRNLYD